MEKLNTKIANTHKANGSVQVIIGALGGMIFSLLAIIVMSIILYLNPMIEKSMPIISQIIKYASAMIASIIACINRRTKGYLRGLIACILYLFLGQLIFGIFGGGVNFNKLFWLDLATFTAIGVITGAIVVNLKSKSK
jgi:putative membrane protein (TIGR04086 family)